MATSFRKALHITLGLFLVILGIAGLVLPLLNGTVLLIVGFIIISFENERIEKFLLRMTAKNHTLHTLHKKLDLFLRKIFKK
jgi:uncharacterized membrane protein YbaN (DUF454 family)